MFRSGVVHSYAMTAYLVDEVLHLLRPQPASMDDEHRQYERTTSALDTSAFSVQLLHHPPSRSKSQVPDAASLLRHDNELAYPSDDDETPNFEGVDVLALCTRSGSTADVNPDPEVRNLETSDVSNDDVYDPIDEDEIELYAIGLYEAVNVEADIDTDHCDSLKDGEPDPPPKPDVNNRPPPTPVADVHMPVTVLAFIATQKTDDFCQTVFATMAQSKSFFFYWEDSVLRQRHPSIPDL